MKPRTNGRQADPPALAALKRAARFALEQARALGTPCYVWQAGKIVDLAATTKRVARPSRRSKNSNGAKRG